MATKDEASVRLGKVFKLLELLGELRAKEAAVLEEIDHVVEGKPGIGAMLRDAMTVFANRWQTSYRGTWVWAYAKDSASMKRLVQAMGHEEVLARIHWYFVNADPFFVQKRHPFGLFVATINQHVAPMADGLDLSATSSVVGCSHAPICRNDVEHTRKRTDEMRAAF